jgi:hypothetical protein
MNGLDNQMRICKNRLSLIALLASASVCLGAVDLDEFQQAVNYIFAGNLSGVVPGQVTETSIVNRQECVVSQKAVTYDGEHLFLYHLNNVNVRDVSIGNSTLVMRGDTDIVEEEINQHGRLIKTSAVALVPVHGSTERTQNALALIFTKYCSPKKTAF